MTNLQVKNLPDDLTEKLRDRARAEHTTVSAFVTRILEREVAKPTLAEWLARLDELPKLEHDIDIEALMGEVKDEIEGR